MPSGHQVAMSLRAAYLTMHRQTQAHLARIGVTAEQFVVLSVLAERDGLTQRELARRASSDPNTIRPILILLERRGLVRRTPHPTDRRARSVKLTSAGREIQGRMSAALKPLQDRLLSAVDPDEGDVLIGLLARIAATLARPDNRQVVLTTSSVRGANRA